MRKLNSFFSRLCMVMLLTLPMVFASCEDDEDSGNMVQDHSFYVVNEGQGNGSICFYDNDGIWHNNIYQENNPGEKLGVTSTTAVFYNGKVYIVSKDNPCLVEADAATFKKTSSITKAVIDDNQAYNFAVINNTTGLIATGRGAYKTAINPLPAEGTKADKIIDGFCRDIYVSGDYLFVIVDNTVKAYKSNDFSYIKDLGTANTGFAKAKDGSLWAANENQLVKINIKDLTFEIIDLPEGYTVNYNSAAYTPTCLCASISENALYFVQKDGWTPKKAYKYDIDNNLVTELVSDPNGYMFYGAGLTVNPKNGYVYATLIKGYGQDALSNTIIIVNGETKETVETIDYSGSFWFPSQIVFK